MKSPQISLIISTKPAKGLHAAPVMGIILILIRQHGGVQMYPIIKPSSELRKNYNSVAEICRTYKTPVFLTRNGEGDMVIMDVETYSRREEDLATAERLLAVERSRLAGTQGYTVDEFGSNMRKAIKKGVAANE